MDSPVNDSPGAQIGFENRERVRDYFRDHPGCKNWECASALDLSVMAVGRHVGALRKEWGAEDPTRKGQRVCEQGDHPYLPGPLCQVCGGYPPKDRKAK